MQDLLLFVGIRQHLGMSRVLPQGPYQEGTLFTYTDCYWAEVPRACLHCQEATSEPLIHYALQWRCLQPIRPSDLPNPNAIDLSSLASLAPECIRLLLENEENVKFVSNFPSPR